MNETEKKSLMGIALVAAFADGEKTEAERTLLQRGADAFAMGPVELHDYYEHAASGVLSVPALAAGLTTPEYRLLAYEMALGICEADDHLNSRERTFLDELQQALGLDNAAVEAAKATTRQVQFQVVASAQTTPPVLGASTPVEKPVERLILEHAIVCGALELLPETLATMAILPTQMKMVYQIGKAHGVALDRGHIKEFVVAAGLGLTSQVVEAYATKLAKGLLGRFLGGLGRAAAGPATGAALSFCTTYALGHVAEQYYAGGRTLTNAQLRAAFDHIMGRARTIQGNYTSEIEACSRNLRLQNLLPTRTH
jgi:uncharacterized protein (DUF697 family)/uncharacterized tellurite resistance protein B-like protein